MAHLAPRNKWKKGFTYIFSRQTNVILSQKKYFFRKKVTIISIAIIIATAIFFLRKKEESIFNWENEAILTSDGSVILQWIEEDEYLTMEITGRTRGYVGIAFSFSDDMTDADVVIGWVKEGVAYIEDRHADHNGHTNLDEIQHYELISGHENETHTTIIFRRKLITCDDMDLNITASSTRIWWTIGDNDLDNSKHKDIQFNQPTSGGIFYNFGHLSVKKPTGKDVMYYDLTINKITASPGYYKTLYWCKFFRLPKMEQKHHLIGYELLAGKDIGRVHHLVVFVCSDIASSNMLETDTGHHCYEGAIRDLDWACHIQMMVLALPLKPSYYPEHIGYPFGSTSDDKPTYLLLQLHYTDFVVPDKALEVTHGVRMLLTKQLRPNDASAFLVGIKNFQLIPANQKEFRSIGICAGACTKKLFPKEGIRLFRLILHAHLRTRKFILHHYRNGVEIEAIEENNFQFHFQPSRFLKKEMVVLPNDTLVVECFANTLGINQTTIGGFESDNEMCILFADYYPAVDVGRCWSVAEETRNLAKIPAIKWNIPDIPKKLTSFLGLYYYMYVEYTMRYLVDWNNITKELQQLYLTGNHAAYCSDSYHALDVWIGDYVNFSRLVPLKKNTCSIT